VKLSSPKKISALLGFSPVFNTGCKEGSFDGFFPFFNTGCKEGSFDGWYFGRLHIFL
jgi:hypothetical protein